MYKSDVVAEVAKMVSSSKVMAEKFVDSFMKVIEKSLKNGKDVNLVGFGSFKLMQTKERKGRNPQTGKEIKIKARKKVKFTAGKKLKESIK